MSGIKNFSQIKKQYKKAIIIFHEDLDGITSAIAMKHYLKNNGIETIDVDQIQYGEKEFSLEKRNLDTDTMLVLVDFAHGKPEFTIHTDHHMKQIGHTQTKSTSFLKAPSNCETLSGITSNPLFPHDDITMISIVDSARFYDYNIKPEEVISFEYQVNKNDTIFKNKSKLTLTTNKLILAYKTRKNFMKELVMESTPSILSIYQNIHKIAKKYDYWRKGRYKSCPPDGLKVNSEIYINEMKSYEDIKLSSCKNVLIQFDAGKGVVNPGAYDRYVSFLNHRDVNFKVLAWSFGTIQVSCNPFKEKLFKDIDLSVICEKVIENHRSELESTQINLRQLKKNMEGKNALRRNPDSNAMGFRWIDLMSRFNMNQLSCEVDLSDIYTNPWKRNIINVLDKPYCTLSTGEKEMLENITLPLYEIVKSGTGGHKSMYNLNLGCYTEDSETKLRQFQMEIVNELELLIKNR